MRVNYSYVGTLGNSNLLLTGRNFCFPFRSLIYIVLSAITRTIKKKQNKTRKNNQTKNSSCKFLVFFSFFTPLLACFRLSDTGEDVKVKGTRFLNSADPTAQLGARNRLLQFKFSVHLSILIKLCCSIPFSKY